MTNRNGHRLGGLLRVVVTPADVGSRVSLRRRLEDGSGQLGDVVGELVSWADGTLVVRTRSGADITVPAAALVAGKVVPPPPVRPSRLAP